jgi:transcriptional regulator with XRE-family HTH domain
MAQKPAKRHVIADIRIQCGLTQPELAEILGCHSATVQRIEQGTLQMSEDFAQKAEAALDVAASYLLANDAQQPPVTVRGGRWTKELYEFAQGARWFATEQKPSGTRIRFRSGPLPLEGAMDEFTAWKLEDYTSKIHAMLESTKGTPRQGILLHRLNNALKALSEDFKPDAAVLEKYEPRLQKLSAAYDKVAKRISDEEHRRIWREEQEP